MLTLSFAVRRVGGSMLSVASTMCSLAMSPELSIWDVGKAIVGARLTPELDIGGVESCMQRDKAPSTRLPSWLSVGEADGGAKRLFSPVLQGARVGESGCRSASAAQVPFVSDALVFPGLSIGDAREGLGQRASSSVWRQRAVGSYSF